MNDSSAQDLRHSLISQARRVIIKLGTAVLMQEKGGMALSRFHSFIEDIASLKREGKEIIIVTSGAIGLGTARLGIQETIPTLAEKQACAAVGQGRLMSLYSDAFDRSGISVAQVLLTEEDLSNRQRYLNLRNTLLKLLELNAIPVINENDTVSTLELEEDEISPYHKINFGDNDKLSALVASKLEADVLVILTDVDGLYPLEKDGSLKSSPIPMVEKITPEIEQLAEASHDRKSKGGRGGIKTKLEAASIATHSGCAVLFASGLIEGILRRIFSGENLGTFFLPQTGMKGKRRWIAFATSVKAALVVNDGARLALQERQASLLPAGVLQVRGDYVRGDVISILDEAGHEFARGIVNYSSEETRRILGKHSEKIGELVENRSYNALIKRENMALLG